MTTSIEKTTHTPGPWKLGSLGGAQHLYRIVQTTDRESVARVMCNGEEGEANAHLIAAAPALLEAAEAAEEWLLRFWHESPHRFPDGASEVGSLLESAIAAAKGERS